MRMKSCGEVLGFLGSKMESSIFRMFAMLSVVAIATIAVACGGDEAEAAPIAEPTDIPTVAPTATPDHGLAPISVNAEIDPAGFLAALPADEQSCIRTSLGDGRFEELLVQEEEPLSEELTALLACVSDDTILNVALGVALAESNVTLSDATLSCVSEWLDDVDLGTLRLLVTDEDTDALGTTELLQFGISAFPAIFCLNDDERAGLGGDTTGDDIFAALSGATIDALECAFDAAGPDGLATMLTIADETDEINPELPAVVGRILADCSAELAASGLLGEDSDLDPIALLEGLLGGDNVPAILGLPEGLLDDLIGGSAMPIVPDLGDIPILPDDITTEEVEALSAEVRACLETTITPDQLAQVEGLSGVVAMPDVGVMIAVLECGEDAAAESGIEFPVGADTLRCLVVELGEDEVNGIFQGTVVTSFSLISAISTCGLDLGDLSG
jgi:hypothetical protein